MLADRAKGHVPAKRSNREDDTGSRGPERGLAQGRKTREWSRAGTVAHEKMFHVLNRCLTFSNVKRNPANNNYQG
jgi:hypothetical protein